MERINDIRVTKTNLLSDFIRVLKYKNSIGGLYERPSKFCGLHFKLNQAGTIKYVLITDNNFNVEETTEDLFIFTSGKEYKIHKDGLTTIYIIYSWINYYLLKLILVMDVPAELNTNILMNIPPRNIKNVCDTSYSFRELCKDKYF